MARIKNAKRTDGRVQSKVYLGTDESGKKLYKYVYADNNTELAAKVQELKLKLGKGIDITAERDTFGYWRDKWLKIKRSEASAKYYESCEICARKLDALAPAMITKLRAMDLQDILLDLAAEVSPSTGKPYSQRTIKIVRDIAAGIAEMALENRVIEYNPFSRVKLPKAQKEPEKREALTKEQQQWILDTPHRAQTAAMIMMYAGLRRGELLALQWSDIDIKAKTISINKSVVMENGKPSIKKGGKTDAAVRTVYIPDILVDYLKDLPRTNFLVCPAANGNLMSQSAWRKLWSSYITDLNVKYGDFDSWKEWSDKHEKGERPSKFHPKELPMLIPNFTAHWLRHTFITNMYHAGVDILTAKQQAGHSDIKVTMEIYTHLDNEYKSKNIDKLNSYLSSKNDTDGCQRGVS